MATSKPARKLTFKSPNTLQPNTVETSSGLHDPTLAVSADRVSYTISYPGADALAQARAQNMASALSAALKKMPKGKGGK